MSAAEQSLLGGLILDASRFKEVSEIVRDKDFLVREHQLIFNAISELCDSGTPVDLTTVEDCLARRSTLEAAGGLAYIGKLANNTPGSANNSSYAEIIKRDSVKRALSKIGEGLIKPNGADPLWLIDQKRTDLDALAARFKPKEGKLITVCAADVMPEKVEWLWLNRIPLGKLTLISGDPGAGKSLLACAIASGVTRGAPWPVDKTPCEPGSVIILSAEDDAADTLRPRLDAAGADVSKIHFLTAVRDVDRNGIPIERSYSIKRDVEALGELLARLEDCRLIVIDPVSAYMDGADAQKNTEVRATFERLVKLIARYRVAVIAISHLRKSEGSALHRAIDSIAFTAVARAYHVVTKEKDNPARRLFVPEKISIGPPDYPGLAYRIGTQDDTAVLEWEAEPVDMTADEALSTSSELDDAKEWLIETLQDGPKPAKQMRQDCKQADHSIRTIMRAKKSLKVVSEKDGLGGWTWRLPEKVGPLGTLGTLQELPDNREILEGGQGCQGGQGYTVVDI